MSASYFDVLGVEPIFGRKFLPEEDAPGGNHAVILGHGLWLRRFGGARDVLGKTLSFDGQPYEVVGVLPPGVYPTWPQATGRMPFLSVYQQVFVPMALSEQRQSDRGSHLFGVLARLDDGVTLERARAEMDTIARRLEATYPDSNAGEAILVHPFMDELVGSARPALLVLLGAVGLVLLIACANMAGLLLARASGRTREVAVRIALGAGRLALMRQFLAESLLLAMAGGALGIGLAALAIDGLIRWSPEHVPRMAQSGLDLTVLGFALTAALVTGVLFGLAPAIQLSRTPIGSSLKEGRRSTGRLAFRRLLVVGEVSIAVVLVVGAGLLIQSFWQLRQVDLGFRAENVLVAELSLPSSTYSDAAQISRFYAELIERVGAAPDVQDVAVAYDHPLDSNWIDSFRVMGGTETRESMAATFRIVSADYFRTMGIDIVRGRAFTELDDTGHPGAVIVNEAFARRYFPDDDALGRALYTSTPRAVWGEPIPNQFEIVGVAHNVKFLGPDAPDEPAFYVPSRQFPLGQMTLVARTTGRPDASSAHVHDNVAALDADLPLGSVTTMERLMSEALAQPRFNMLLLGLFGAAAMVLAAMGIYGLLSFNVSQRTNEIGIRMALGARAADVLSLVVRQGLSLVAIGLVLGVVGALAAARVMTGLLFGVRANDPVTLVAVTLFLGIVALLASYLPARRATQIAPVTALRHE